MFIVRTKSPGLAVDTSVYANHEAALGEAKRRLGIRNDRDVSEWHEGDGRYQATVVVTITKAEPDGE
jgi:hypothetical protein